MTFAQVSPTHKNAVRPFLQTFQNILGRYGSCTHDPDRSDTRRILHSTDPSQVSGCVASPCAQKGDDGRFEIIGHDHVSLGWFAYPLLMWSNGLGLSADGPLDL